MAELFINMLVKCRRNLCSCCIYIFIIYISTKFYALCSSLKYFPITKATYQSHLKYLLSVQIQGTGKKPMKHSQLLLK